MIKSATSFFISFLFLVSIKAQSTTKTFQFLIPNYKIYNSYYNSIDFLDSRTEGSAIGKVFSGLLKNSESNLVLPNPAKPEFQKIVDALIDTSAKNGKLLFQLRRFWFCETSNTRFCFLSASLYVQNNNAYTKLAYLDTVMLFTGSGFQNALMERSSTIISDFISRNLVQQPRTAGTYSYAEVKQIDSIEKIQLPLYEDSTYTDGIYSNYKAFSNQKPDLKGQISTKHDGSIVSIKITDRAGKLVKLKSMDIYAVVNKGRLFAATAYGYYPLSKIGTDFYFTGQVNGSGTVIRNQGPVELASVGKGISSLAARITYYLMIDHVNGRLIHLQFIETDAP